MDYEEKAREVTRRVLDAAVNHGDPEGAVNIIASAIREAVGGETKEIREAADEARMLLNRIEPEVTAILEKLNHALSGEKQ